MNSLVDDYLKKVKNWKDELTVLRSIVLESGLVEELKWRNPCYTFDGKNIVIIGGFKEFCVLSFFKGILLSDPEKILKQQGENTQSARIIPFTSVSEILLQKHTILAYIYEAVEIERQGLQVEFKKTTESDFPIELENKFKEIPDFKEAFLALTPGRQRAYLLYFKAPVQSKTRDSRIDSSLLRIFYGKGINDCVCGLSKKMPGCDGSHKFLK
ncbi:MAG: YdeI/OmpD-associated family protein [Saprospiraceae bacterium]|nr:YdeI/OmpD-associated family protein [Saprospiraceae bacterium]